MKGRSHNKKPASLSLGDRLGRAGTVALIGGVPAAFVLGDIITAFRRAKASSDFDKELGHSEKLKAQDLNIPPFSYNQLDDKKPAVFDDEEKALDALHPDWRKRTVFRRWLLKQRIRALLNNPQFISKHNAVFVPKQVDARVLAHELGHATDNIKTPLNRWERLAFHPKAFVPFIIDPDNTPLMQQERRAWDNGNVPEDDKLRAAALRTYREYQETLRRPYRYGLGAAVLGGLLLGGGALANSLTGKRAGPGKA